MLRSDYADQNCSVARALEAVGERWTLLIVRELLRKPSRFSELQRHLGVARNVLANRLDKLREFGIVDTDLIEAARDWKEYRLTRKGMDLFPIVHALMSWGDRYLAPDGPPVVIEHACGHPVQSSWTCAHCGEPVSAHKVRTREGAGWRDGAGHWGAPRTR